MPPVSERAARVRFRRALSLMAMTLVAPGSAQMVAGNRRVGLVALRIWIGLLGLLVFTLAAIAVHRDLVFWLGFNPSLLLLLRLALIVAAVGWAYLFIDAWRLGQPLSLGLGHRRAVVSVNGLLSLTVAGSLLFGAHLVGVQRDLVVTLSGDGEVTGAHDGRFNFLLMGGDSGDGRWGLRPDSMTVASIDAESGRTVLISLPRNMEDFPFREDTVMHEQFPDGFDCEGCYLNGVSTWAGDNTELFPKSDNPGVDATIMAIEGITGLRINYWAMVNLEGFKSLVDAVGGVELTVRDRIPVGGLGSDVTGYIEPGTRTLDGFETLWYARAREGSDDYSRMARQKCVMNAMLQQVSPQAAVANFGAIAEASTELISTNLPASEFDRFMPLALKARDQKISTLSLVPPMINPAEPDIPMIQDKVTSAIDEAEGDAPPAKAKKKKAPSTITGGSIGSRDEGYAANDSEDLGTAC